MPWRALSFRREAKDDAAAAELVGPVPVPIRALAAGRDAGLDDGAGRPVLRPVAGLLARSPPRPVPHRPRCGPLRQGPGQAAALHELAPESPHDSAVRGYAYDLGRRVGARRPRARRGGADRTGEFGRA